MAFLESRKSVLTERHRKLTLWCSNRGGAWRKRRGLHLSMQHRGFSSVNISKAYSSSFRGAWHQPGVIKDKLRYQKPVVFPNAAG